MIYCLSVNQDKLKLSKGGNFVLAQTVSQVLQSKIKYYSEHLDLIGGRRKIVRSKFIMYYYNKSTYAFGRAWNFFGQPSKHCCL